MISATTEAAANGQDPLVPSDATSGFDAQSEMKPKETLSSTDGSKPKESITSVEPSATDVDSTVVQEGGAVNPSAAETWSFVYAQLARQLEYYFSEKNLSKDTYVQTLRQLNDGCVPLSILANFAMVKRLVMSLTFVIDEVGRLAAVEEAARNYSDRLMVCLIDAKTGKRVEEEETETQPDASHNILAVGTTDGKPLVMDSSIPQTSPFVKTIVLRDVVDGVTPEEIHDLFNYEGFPPVSCIQPDVANCWFVTLDTEDRNDILEVLVSLRSMTLREHPVHARIKSTVVTVDVDSAPVMPWVPPVPEVGGESGGDTPKRKKKKVRGSKKKKGGANASNSTASNSKKGKKEPAKPSPPPPPTLGEENFPTLQDKTVEWDTEQVDVDKAQVRRGSNASEVEDYDDEEERNDKSDDVEDDKDEPKSGKAMSDGASTATTTSSSLESVPKKAVPTVGYAAALMGRSGGFYASEGQANKNFSVRSSVDPKPDATIVPEVPPVLASLAPKSDAWGGRRSFADILRVPQENAESASS